MKVGFKLKPFVEALNVTRRAVLSKTDREILKYMKLSATDKVTLTGSDLETSVLCEVPEAIIDAPGEALLPMRTVEAIRRASGDTIELSMADDHLRIATDRERFKVQCADPFEFPPVEFDPGAQFDVDATTVCYGLGIASAAASKDPDSQYALQGVFFDCNGGELCFAATDTHICVGFHTKVKVDPWEHQVVVPIKAVAIIKLLAAKAQGNVSFSVAKSQLSARVGNVTVVSRLLDGRFPGWRDVIPNKHNSAAQSVAGPLIAAIDRATLFTEEDTRGVDFVFGRDSLTLKTSTSDVGESEIVLPVVFTGDPLSILLDPRFVTSFLRVLSPETPVSVRMIDDESAITIKLENDETVTCVVMPLSKWRSP